MSVDNAAFHRVAEQRFAAPIVNHSHGTLVRFHGFGLKPPPLRPFLTTKGPGVATAKSAKRR